MIIADFEKIPELRLTDFMFAYAAYFGYDDTNLKDKM